MTAPERPSVGWAIAGALMLVVGASVFLIRFQHAGPYEMPAGGNLRAGVLALLLGAWLVRPWWGTRGLAAALRWGAIAACVPVLFFALYATLAELEEVVVLRAKDAAGQPANLRLWIVDKEDGAWVAMPVQKADAHSLAAAPLQLLRRGEERCVIAKPFTDRETLEAVVRLRHEKYSIQRLATRIGLFEERPSGTTVVLRLDPCEDAEAAAPPR
ncbi:MAG: hypothetical protein JRH01_17185 [Deltaproteobacteria bacterium]|nr:hypothetical protein [Deltaproteobacteria bacterium]MBW2397128.1 hypothetical protein [Deltaproteobacteria bacterium]